MSQSKLFDLHSEILDYIFNFIDFSDIGKFMIVSKSANNIGYDYFKYLWDHQCGWGHLPFKVLCLENFKKMWYPQMTIMPINHVWLVIGLSTCTLCKLINFRLALDNFATIYDRLDYPIQKELLMCDRCSIYRTCEDCTTIHTSLDTIKLAAACADLYSCCEKKQCINRSCIWKCYYCNLILDPTSENCEAIEEFINNRSKKRIICSTCYEKSHDQYVKIDKLVWYGLSFEEYEQRYG